MRTRFILAALACSVAFPIPALAFHPFEETYGYRPPQKKAAIERYDRNDRYDRYDDDDDDDDDAWWNEPQQERRIERKNRRTKSPAIVQGGSRPHISAVAPPIVTFPNSYGKGTIIIDTAGRSLYYVLSSDRAYRYPISVGKTGFTWTGTQSISRKVAWPDWYPPEEMRQRHPDLPVRMTGGIRNPLGAMALYLGNSLYRIHGTNDIKSIGRAASSGCFRMRNAHVMHLSRIAGVGTTVKVVNRLPRSMASGRVVRDDS
jgi:lipoprotein-anchoring transpeptidase ErfK/SrfK